MDKIYLLNSWPFLVSHLKDVIDDLQGKASVVYEQEQSRCPQRAHRLSMSTTPSNFLHQRGANKPGRPLTDLTNSKNLFCKLHQIFSWILKAGGNRLTERLLEGPPTEDSIIDLEKQEGILFCINSKALELCRIRFPILSLICGMKCVVFHGHTSNNKFVESNLLETEEGFVKLFTKDDNPVHEEPSDEEASSHDDEGAEASSPYCPTVSNLRELYKV